MEIFSAILIIIGLALFEGISSFDNAIINADVLQTVGKKARRWFLTWGLFFGVFVVRGVLPWLILWLATPGVGPAETFFAMFQNNTSAKAAIETAAPILLAGGGIFLLFLFLHWLFLEQKSYGLPGEKFFHTNGLWFYAVVSIILSGIVWFAIKINPMMAFGAVVGSSAFFITHGFKQQAEKGEEELLRNKGSLSDVSKIVYLEVIDSTFSIDGVLGAFAFTFSIPLILLGNGFGALIVRYFTVNNIENVKKYIYLKNGAMYSVLFLGLIMTSEAFGIHVPPWLAPITTFGSIGWFFLKSKRELSLAQ
ncbi:MAG: DUF475 domain-containing protein [Candidatus Paceibacterota bacterium]|jgi:hypothetical protein|nr:DUF475 domain-containing protein [Candidatus Paceibacterota bacterium]